VENRIRFYFPFLLCSFTVELLFPSEIRGEVTLTRLLLTAIFSLTFGPIFEELLSEDTYSKEVMRLFTAR